jgi:hypothetical protein
MATQSSGHGTQRLVGSAGINETVGLRQFAVLPQPNYHR